MCCNLFQVDYLLTGTKVLLFSSLATCFKLRRRHSLSLLSRMCYSGSESPSRFVHTTPFIYGCLRIALAGPGHRVCRKPQKWCDEDGHLPSHIWSVSAPVLHCQILITHSETGVGALVAPLVATQFSEMQKWSYFFFISLGLALINIITIYVSFGSERIESQFFSLIIMLSYFRWYIT